MDHRENVILTDTEELDVLKSTKCDESPHNGSPEVITSESQFFNATPVNSSNSLTFVKSVKLLSTAEEMKQDLLILRDLLVKQEHQYRENLQRSEKIMANLESRLEKGREEMKLRKEALRKKCEENLRCQEIMKEYEKAVERFIGENEESRACFEEDKLRQECELEAMKDHLANTEKAYEDLQIKYQSTKNSMLNIPQFISDLKSTADEYMTQIEKLKGMFISKKQEADLKCSSFNEEMASLKQSNQSEISRLSALIKKSELRISSLKVSLEQKTKENKALLAMCDEILNSQPGEDSSTSSNILNCNISE